MQLLQISHSWGTTRKSLRWMKTVKVGFWRVRIYIYLLPCINYTKTWLLTRWRPTTWPMYEKMDLNNKMQSLLPLLISIPLCLWLLNIVTWNNTGCKYQWTLSWCFILPLLNTIINNAAIKHQCYVEHYHHKPDCKYQYLGDILYLIMASWYCHFEYYYEQYRKQVLKML